MQRSNSRDQAALQRGRVVLACMPTLANAIVPSAIGAFCARYPLVAVDLIDQPSRMVEGSVMNAEADLGIGSKPEWISTLSFEKLAVDRFVAIVPAGARNAKDKVFRVSDLARHRLITLQPSPSIRRAVGTSFCGRRAVIRTPLSSRAPDDGHGSGGGGARDRPAAGGPQFRDIPRTVCGSCRCDLRFYAASASFSGAATRCPRQRPACLASFGAHCASIEWGSDWVFHISENPKNIAIKSN